MALNDKNIIITPNIGSTSDPKIEFKGADASTGPSTITATVYPTNGGTLSFQATEGTLFSISNSLSSGSIFSVNPISGIPIIDVNANRTILLNPYGGNTGIGTANPTSKLHVVGDTLVTGVATALSFVSTSASGAPFTVSSTTLVTNLNADLLDGKNTGTSGNTIPLLDGVNTWSGNQTFTGQIISTRANDATTGAGQIYLNGATNNRIDFAQVGVNPPATTTRSTGTKIVLRPELTASAVDYAIGIDGFTLWSSVPTASNSFQHRWYAATTQLADLKGSGEFVLGATSLTGTASQKLQVTGGGYVSGSVGVGFTNPSYKLHVAGDIKSSQALHFGSGGAYEAGTIYSDANWGVIIRALQASPATADFLFTSAADTYRLKIDTSGNVIIPGSASATGTASQLLQVNSGAYISGNLGLGISNPAFKLDVFTSGGNSAIRNRTDIANGYSYYILQNSGASGREYHFGLGGSTIGAPLAGNVYLYDATAGVTRWITDSSGNFIIGSASATGTASQALQVNSGAYISGNLGLGVTNPYQKLHLESTTSPLTLNLKLNKTSTTSDYAEIAFQLWNGATSGTSTFGDAGGTSRPSVVLRAINEAAGTAAGAFVVATFAGGANNSTLTEKFRISSAGNVTTTNNILLGTSVSGGTATPAYIDLGLSASNGVTRDKCKIYLYNSGTEQYGFGVGITGDIQYHSNFTHDFYVSNTAAARISSNRNLLVGSFSETGTASQRLQITGGGYVSGNFGVGVTNPSEKLEVNGNLKVILDSTSTAKNVARIIDLGYSGITGAKNWTLRGVYQYPSGVSGNADGGDLDLIKSLDGFTVLATKTDGTTLGRVGIGSAAPKSMLDIRSPQISITESNNATINAQSSGLLLQTDFGDAAGSNGAGIKFAQRWFSGSTANIVTGAIYGYKRNVSGGFGGGLKFATSNATGNDIAERMVIDDSGNVGVATNIPLQKLHVQGNLLVAAGSATGQHITQKPYELNGGTLSWEGSAGQLFSITNNLTSGSIFSVNDVSGIPSIDVDASGVIELAPYGGNVGVGTINPTSKLHVVGDTIVTGVSTASRFVSTVATGTAPLTVTSTTLVTNLNADLLDGKNTGTSGNTIPLLDGTNTWSGSQTFSNQIVSTLANNTATGGGQIFLNGATGNRIDFVGGGVGVAAPTFTTRSVGTKIVLYPELTSSLVDYALGIESATLWSSIPGSGYAFKWYAGTSNIATLFASGTFSATGDFRAPIFYDSAVTAYYLDPGSGSNLNGTLTNNGGTAMTGSWNRNLYLVSTFPVIVFNSNNTKYSGIGVDHSVADGGMRFWVNGSSADLTAANVNAMNINTGNFVTATGSFRSPLFYDSDNTGYYLNPASTSVTNAQNIVNLYDSSVTRFLSPSGGFYTTNTATVTGAIRIRLPANRRNSATMLRFTVKIYEYNTGYSTEFQIGGYNYSLGGWINVFATQLTDASRGAFTVRFGDDTARDFITIGEVGTTWSYPQVFITDVQCGFGGQAEAWGSDWLIDFVTTLPTTVETTRTASLVKTSNNASNWAFGDYATTFYNQADTASYWTANDFILRGTSPTITFRDSNHNTAYLHCNDNLLYILRGGNDLGTGGWSQVDGAWPLYINLINNDATFGRTVSSIAYVNNFHFYSNWRITGSGVAASNAYNSIMGADNDTGNKLAFFLNSSTRTADGGANGLTFRNDGGPLNLGSSGYATNILGSSVSVTGNLSSNGTVTGTQLISTIPTGTAPLTVTSTTLVSNLNADLLDGINSGSFLRSDTTTTWSGSASGVFQVTLPAGASGSTNTTVNTLQLFQATANADSFLSFHVSGDYAAHFGIDGTTNDLFVGGWSYGAVKYKVWHAGNYIPVVESLRANRSITGGGTITVDASYNVLWTARFIVISSGRGTNFSTAGYFDITCPTSGTITGVGGAANKTATAAGIPLAQWEALYYILPIGSANTSLAANFRVASYTANLDIPHDWVLICVRNSESTNESVYFNNGIVLSAGESMNAIQQDNANTANTLVRRDASGNFSAGTITASLTGSASNNVLKAGDAMTGQLTVASPSTYAAISSLTISNTYPIYVPEVNAVSGGFTPFLVQRTLVTGGYRQVLSLGSYRAGAASYSGGVYIAPGGGSDNNPTDYFLLSYGGALTYSGGNVSLTGSSSLNVLKSGDTMTGQLTMNEVNLTINSNVGANGATALSSMNGRLVFDNDYSDAARGPNKIQLLNDASTWVAGFGVHASTVSYYSGDTHKWYKSNSVTSFTEVMTLNNAGYLVAANAVASPIFYDSVATAYYADLNNAGISINVAGSVAAEGAFRAESSDSAQRFEIYYNEAADSLDFDYIP